MSCGSLNVLTKAQFQLIKKINCKFPTTTALIWRKQANQQKKRMAMVDSGSVHSVRMVESNDEHYVFTLFGSGNCGYNNDNISTLKFNGPAGLVFFLLCLKKICPSRFPFFFFVRNAIFKLIVKSIRSQLHSIHFVIFYLFGFFFSLRHLFFCWNRSFKQKFFSFRINVFQFWKHHWL